VRIEPTKNLRSNPNLRVRRRKIFARTRMRGANHLALIRSFLIDFGVRDRRAGQIVQIFFAVRRR
jgi:hypothetical protein